MAAALPGLHVALDSSAAGCLKVAGIPRDRLVDAGGHGGLLHPLIPLESYAHAWASQARRLYPVGQLPSHERMTADICELIAAQCTLLEGRDLVLWFQRGVFEQRSGAHFAAMLRDHRVRLGSVQRAILTGDAVEPALCIGEHHPDDVRAATVSTAPVDLAGWAALWDVLCSRDWRALDALARSTEAPAEVRAAAVHQCSKFPGPDGSLGAMDADLLRAADAYGQLSALGEVVNPRGEGKRWLPADVLERLHDMVSGPGAWLLGGGPYFEEGPERRMEATLELTPLGQRALAGDVDAIRAGASSRIGWVELTAEERVSFDGEGLVSGV